MELCVKCIGVVHTPKIRSTIFAPINGEVCNQRLSPAPTCSPFKNKMCSVDWNVESFLFVQQIKGIRFVFIAAEEVAASLSE